MPSVGVDDGLNVLRDRCSRVVPSNLSKLIVVDVHVEIHVEVMVLVNGYNDCTEIKRVQFL